MGNLKGHGYRVKKRSLNADILLKTLSAIVATAKVEGYPEIHNQMITEFITSMAVKRDKAINELKEAQGILKLKAAEHMRNCPCTICSYVRAWRKSNEK